MVEQLEVAGACNCPHQQCYVAVRTGSAKKVVELLLYSPAAQVIAQFTEPLVELLPSEQLVQMQRPHHPSTFPLGR